MPVTQDEARILHLETALTKALRELKEIRDELAAIRQNAREERMWLTSFLGTLQNGTPEMKFARLPSGGIAAAASGTVEFYADGSFATLTGTTATAYNNWSDAANPTSRKCVVISSNLRWQVLLWGCS